jgi:photosystem II stability/assembly factor-like uncharacterized protein
MNRLRIYWLLLIVLISVAVFSEKLAWSLTNPSLTGTPLFDCFFISPKEGWVCGGNGRIFHTADSGKTWEIQLSPLNYGYPLRSLYFINSDTGFAVGGNPGQRFSLMTIDGGNSWMDVSQHFPYQMTKIICKPSGELWIIFNRPTGQLAYSNDLGTTMNELTLNASTLNDITFINSLTGFVCGNKGYIGKTIDGGQTWNRMNIDSLENYESIRFINSQIGYCVSLNANIYKTLNGGSDWSFTGRIGSQYYFNNLHFVNSDTGMVIGASDIFVVYKTFNGGANWQNNIFPLNHPQTITGITFPSQGHGIAISTHGSIYHVMGFADSIKEVTFGTGDDVISVSAYDTSFIICGRQDGTVLITYNAGLTWKERLIKKGVCIGSIYFIDKDNLIAFNKLNARDIYSMGVFHSNDGGITWDTAGNISVNSHYINSRDKHAVFAVKNGFLVRSLDRGETWETRSDVSFILNIDTLWIKGNLLKDIYFLDKNIGWLTSNKGYVTKTTDGGLTWSMTGIAPEGTFVNDIFFCSPDTGFIAGLLNNSPMIFLTSDGGKSWDKLATLNFNSDQKAKWENYQIYPSIIKIAGNTLNDLWALSDLAGVFHSTDTGVTWTEEILPQDGRVYEDMAILSNGNIIVTGDNSQIWRYGNNGVPVTKRNRLIALRNDLEIIKFANHIIQISKPNFKGYFSVYIFNCEGKLIKKISSMNSGSKKIIINIKGLKTGYYIFKMKTPFNAYYTNYLITN